MVAKFVLVHAITRPHAYVRPRYGDPEPRMRHVVDFALFPYHTNIALAPNDTCAKIYAKNCAENYSIPLINHKFEEADVWKNDTIFLVCKLRG